MRIAPLNQTYNKPQQNFGQIRISKCAQASDLFKPIARFMEDAVRWEAKNKTHIDVATCSEGRLFASVLKNGERKFWFHDLTKGKDYPLFLMHALCEVNK